MALHNWGEMPEEQMNPLVGRKVIHGETMTVARLRLAKGAVVPLHHHVSEQITNVEQGRLRFVLGGEEVFVGAGESLLIPPNVAHEVEALEDSVALDLFSPPREDWKRGDDSYLRK